MKESISEYSHTKMPWGKHKGVYIKDLPEDYLIWAAKNWGDIAARTMFEIELLRRIKYNKVKI